MKKREHNSVLSMWEKYLESIGEFIDSTKKEYLSWHFEITEGAANKLAKLVLEGKKKATASSLWVYEHARKEGVGDLSLEYWMKVHEEFFMEECNSIGGAHIRIAEAILSVDRSLRVLGC